MGLAQVIEKYEGPSGERTWDNQQVAEALSSHTESQQFIPAMERILPYQGTNARVLLYKCLVEGVISNGWLDQPPPAAFSERIEKENLSLETITKRGKSKEHYLWRLAGAVTSSGRWKQFQSQEQYYKLLMTFWGMRAPLRTPALTGEGIFDEGSVSVSFSGRVPHKDFVAAYRSSLPSTSQEELEDAEVTQETREEPRPVLIVEEGTMYPWNTKIHPAWDFLWSIMSDAKKLSVMKDERFKTDPSSIHL